MKPWLETEVLVIGAGAAGVPAAIGAARQGAQVILLDDDALPGGAAVDQFVSMPDGGPRSGVSLEMTRRLEAQYALTDRPVDKWWYFWYLPSDMAVVILEMIAAEPNLRLMGSARATRLTVEERGGKPRVTGAIVPDSLGRERWIKAAVTIEATGEGALAEGAGCEARYGEDSRADFDEPGAPDKRSAGVQLCTWMFISQRIGSRPAADPGFFPRGCESGGYGSPPTNGDDTPWRLRNAGLYLHWGCRVECRDTRDPIALADAQRDGLAAMRANLESLRANGWSFHLAPRIGVRETRRIMGEHVVSANDLFQGRIPDDSVLITQRPIDIWSKAKTNMDYPETKPYGIPYRALVPRGVDGLLVAGKHMSGTHLAMASYRVQMLLGQLGQAAGVAAALALRGGTQPRNLEFKDLNPVLTAKPQNLVIRGDREWVAPP
jgi:hypothetical protein